MTRPTSSIKEAARLVPSLCRRMLGGGAKLQGAGFAMRAMAGRDRA
jgi:hypothetical protein